jgi:enoyl-CoA hydratase/carnithine racemase
MERAAYVERRGPVGWVIIKDVQEGMEDSWGLDEYMEIHTAVASGLDELRFDPQIRIVGITGERDGEFYSLPRRERFDSEPRHRHRHNFSMRGDKSLHPRGPSRGVANAIETLAMIEKPVIARVNGDAIGFGQSLLWGCDILVGVEFGVVSDVHMGQGDPVDHRGERRGFPYAIAPGDGAMAFLPLFMPPTKAKEYQLLSRAWTVRELAEMGVFNYALPGYEELDAKVDELIDELLARPQHALQHTKRLHNKLLIWHWNLAKDLSQAYELLDFWQHNAQDHMRVGWDPYDEAPPRHEGGWSPATKVVS